EGEVRAVVATLTPEEVIEGREKFKKDIEENVKERMAELGFKLISLNITEVKDNNDHYNNLAAKDREEKRRIAANLRAEEQKSINETAAITSQVSESARIARDMTVAEKNRDLQLKQAGFREETDKADKTAEFAGRLEEQDKLKDLATKEGEVAVEREKQNQRAAGARRDVETTLAETEKQKAIINAEASKKRMEIEADAQATIVEKRAVGEAQAARQRARGEAEAAIERARGEADAMKAAADAEAEKIRKTRMANAEGIEAEGRAEAEAIRQKGLAEAEAERAKAEALAAQDGVNLKVTLAEIESQTRIKVSTAIATAVAEVGTNATIIDMGAGGGTGEADLLSRMLGGLPETLAKLDVKNAALNGQPFAGTINDLIRAVTNKPENYIVPAVAGAVAGKILSDSSEEAPVDTVVHKTPVAPKIIPGSTATERPKRVRPERKRDDSSEVPLPVTLTPSEVVALLADEPLAEKTHGWQLPFDKGDGAKASVDEPLSSAKDTAVESFPVLTLEDSDAVVSLAIENKLNEVETLELAQVYATVKDAGELLNEEMYQIAANAVDVIKTLRKSGESFDARNVAKAVLDLDADASTADIVKRVAELAKKAPIRRKR
ncbi:MAG: SPFH domain-containing protein, partial [Coriobacteriia bacterium]|nr:SPFH domain-containing protein [Coriobacteriia bacterium]